MSSWLDEIIHGLWVCLVGLIVVMTVTIWEWSQTLPILNSGNFCIKIDVVQTLNRRMILLTQALNFFFERARPFLFCNKSFHCNILYNIPEMK